MKNQKNRKAFTLIELLVVIAIIAVLSVVVILSLNPAELLRQSRDSNRISDMATLKSALSLYLADVAVPSLGTSLTCYASAPATTWAAVSTGGTPTAATTTCGAWMVTANAASSSNGRSNTGVGGWLPVNFNAISSGAPIGSEPVDPTNSTGTASCATGALASCGLFYSYESTSTVFKIAAFLESSKYSKGGGADVESVDGGQNVYYYEQGTNLNL
jgi:prepilin-type N-terminal cleavage/methylation domain-containing protein